MLPVSWTTIRLFLHVLAATIWVGGQFTLAGLVPGLRAAYPDAPRFAARRFALISWPAFAVLFVTGIWNLVATDAEFTGKYGVTLFVKLLVVAVSGVSAAAHSLTKNKALLALGGALAGLSALAALFLGVLLHG